MTTQEAFDKIAKHLLTQQSRSYSYADFTGEGGCAYRSYDGKKCAVGCLIPQEIYEENMEGYRVGTLIEKFPKVRELLLGVDQHFLYAAQVVHDRYNPLNWKSELRALAKSYGLNDAILDTLPDIQS